MKGKTLLLLIIFLAFGVRAAGILSQSLWRDEVDAVIFASAPLKEVLGYFTRPGWNGPFYYLLLKGWLGLAGNGEFALRYFSLLFGVLSLPLIFKLAQKFLPERLAITATLLSSFSPYLIWYSQEGKMYGLWLCLATLAFLLHLKALDGVGLKRWTLYLVTMIASFYTHFHTFFLLLGQLTLYLWPNYRKKWREGFLAHYILAIPLIPVIRWLLPSLLSPNPTGFPYYPLPDMLGILFTGWNSGVFSTLWPWSLIPAGIVALGGIAERKNSLPLIAVLLLPVLGLFTICLHRPIFTDRYLIFLAPFFYMLLSLGLGFWGARRKFLDLLLLSSILLVDAEATWSQNRFPIKSDFRGAVALFKQYAQEGDAVVFQIPYVRQVFDYYLAGEKPYIPIDGPYTNWGMTSRQVDNYLRSRIGQCQRAWLILSETEMWDSRGLTEKWFEENFTPQLKGYFTRVTIVLYSRPCPMVDLKALRYKCFLPLVLR